MAQAIQEQLKRRSELHKAIEKAGEQLKEVRLQPTRPQGHRPSPYHLPTISQVQQQSTKLQGKAGKEKKVAELDAQARAVLRCMLCYAMTVLHAASHV
jgi:hypothetical protein